MTYSIVARDPANDHIGVAAVTALPAVGKLVTHVAARIGAVATQAFVNPFYGIDGLTLLASGRDAKSVLDELLKNDPNRQKRQVGILDSTGRAAAWTGNETADWAGHLSAANYSAQGNRLTCPDVLDAIVNAFEKHSKLDLIERLILAIDAARAVGGDRKGERSANVIVCHAEDYPVCDLRVDDADDPVAELHRLHDIYHRRLKPNIQMLPRRDQPEGQLIEEHMLG